MNRKSATGPASKSGQLAHYGARVLDSERHDPYQPKGKYRDMRCSACGALYRSGRWQWSSTDETAAPGTCPACRRIADRMPAGRLSLEGPYVAQHHAELVQIAQHEADAERAEHPMHRIMALDPRAGGIEITTTDIHLPRRIGEALRRAHDGDLTFAFSDNAYEIRVHWRR
jgi:hypothetical protein